MKERRGNREVEGNLKLLLRIAELEFNKVKAEADKAWEELEDSDEWMDYLKWESVTEQNDKDISRLYGEYSRALGRETGGCLDMVKHETVATLREFTQEAFNQWSAAVKKLKKKKENVEAKLLCSEAWARWLSAKKILNDADPKLYQCSTNYEEASAAYKTIRNHEEAIAEFNRIVDVEGFILGDGAKSPRSIRHIE